jgi:hypothetical protein
MIVTIVKPALRLLVFLFALGLGLYHNGLDLPMAFLMEKVIFHLKDYTDYVAALVVAWLSMPVVIHFID